LLASAFPPPTVAGTLTALPNQPASSGLMYPNLQNYTSSTLLPTGNTNSSMQQLMSENIALSQQGSALSMYLQQVQQVLNTQRIQSGPIFAAPKMNQPTPTVVSATPASGPISKEKPTTDDSLPTKSKSNAPRAKKYEKIVQTLKPELSSKQQASLKQFEDIFQKNKAKYEAVAKRLNVPDELVALTAKAIWAIHCREGSCDFSTYLHNGEKLGKPTTLQPIGVSFNNWEDAAVDAIKLKLSAVGGKVPQSLPEWLSFSEIYNGLGYENKGVPSPYVLAGTTAYQKGKYVADGKYDANHVDQRLGVAVLLTS
jgi:lysozyme family protein